jgi:large subunit ribosomal protein L7A
MTVKSIGFAVHNFLSGYLYISGESFFALKWGDIMSDKLPVNRIVGGKQTIKAIKSGNAKTVYIAEDAEQKVIKPLEDLCKENNIEIIYICSMQKLGFLCGIDVGAATACVTNQ